MRRIQEKENKQSDSEVYLGPFDVLRNKYNALRIRGTKLLDEVTEFAKWLEFDAARLATENNQDQIWIDLDSDGNVQRLWIGAVEKHEELLQHHTLWKYFASLGICKVCLDPRLEMNQIQDLFVFLKSREKILRFRGKRSRNAVSSSLLDGQSIHFSCANVILRDNVLSVKYSYCTLRYSHLVHWLERCHKTFHDHRVLFHMAPRYGLIVAAVILAPSILFVAWYQEWLILLILLAAALVLYGMTYLFLMVVGSVEYDNEEKAYQLSRAYSQLKFYASRIQDDIHRARTIQQCFLPDISKMPMCQLLDWASSYLPADEVGGDYFDIKSLDDDRIVIIFADACGHGMAAALVTAVIKATFQDWLETSVSLENLAQQLNRNIYFTTPSGYFAAVFLAILNGKTGRLEYINCGHQPEPWILRGTNDGINEQLDQARCMILGIEEDIDIKKAVVSLRPRDGILIVSDGITENQDIEGNMYGQERFEELLRKNATSPIKNLAKLIIGEAESFSRGTSLKDDQTLLAFRLK
jgi:serine phosphatase RsbU (regulator of sigma subunit)